MVIKRISTLAFVLLALMGPGCGSALAVGRTPAASHNVGPGSGTGGRGGVNGVAAGGSLPFTGANLALYASVGVAMAAAGAGLRRIAGRDSAPTQK